MKQLSRKLMLPALLAVLLSACTVTFVPDSSVAVNARVRLAYGIEVYNVINVFEPTRGAGAVYGLGENVAFRVRTSQSGYITLTAIDVSGAVYTLVRNVYVSAGETRVISGNDQGTFSTAPPRGLQRVRASFTPSPTDTARIVYNGIFTEDRWTNSIVTEVRPYDVRDIVETRFFIE